MNCFHQSYDEAARAFWFQGARRFSHKFAGPRRIPSSSPSAAENALWPIIYRWHYLRDSHAEVDPPHATTLREREDPEFVAMLSAANRSSGVWDPGWSIRGAQANESVCEKEGLVLCVPASDVRGSETVDVRFPSERRHWMPGYYCTAGGRTAQPDFRVYLNVKPQCAAWLLQTVTSQLEERGASYQLKLLNHPRAYTRPDASVLYMSGGGIEDCRRLLETLAAAPSAFRAQTPALTRTLYRGIAIADEPPATAGRPVSFGEHRSRMVARGLARARAEGGLTVEQRLQAIYSEFESHGLDASRPYSAASGGIAGVF
jgi:hypothetical protein